MGKSPGKWIKSVILGKKSSKSNLSKDATSEIKVSITGKTPSNNYGADSMIISSPVRPVIDSSDHTHTELEKSSSANLITESPDIPTTPIDLTAITGEDLIKLEQAATKAQAAFRGYLARRAFWALKGIIRLQALVRGHLVRRQAVATLKCMRAIVEFQALARGRKVRLSGSGQLLQKYPMNKKASELLQTSMREEKLSTNMFATKLVASSNTTMALSFQYEPIDPNSVTNWLERWSTSHFWDPLPQPKKTPDLKPKRKQHAKLTEETETGRPKRSVRKVPENTNSSENEKSRRTVRKFSNHHIPEPVQAQEQSLNELEKVKRNLRKISLSNSVPEKSETEPEIKKTEIPPPVPSPIQEMTEKTEEINGSYVEVVKEQTPIESVIIENENNKPVDDVEHEQQTPIEPLINSEEGEKVVVNGKEDKVKDNGVKESQKTRRRKSLPAKQELNESVAQNSPTLPSYMAATESAKAKLRAQAAAEAAENGGGRRQSLSSGGKPSLPSPRVQKPIVNGKSGTKLTKSQISPKDEKVVQAGWKR